MATINTELPSLLDQTKRLDPDGKEAVIAEWMAKRSPAIRDAVFLEGNLPTGHRVTARTGLPSIHFRRYNEGIRTSKSRTDQFDEACGMLVGRSAVDVDLAELNGGERAARASEDKAFTMSFVQGAERGLWYESVATGPEKFTGLTPRLDSLSGPYADQIVVCDPDAAGNNNTSMWLVTWGPETVFGIFPKGSVGGLKSTDRGILDVQDRNGRPYPAYVTDHNWKLGFCVKDARYLSRICNIDLNRLNPADDTLIDAMIEAYERIESHGMGRMVFYCNRRVRTNLWKQARNAVKNSTLTIENVEGRPVPHFMGIPIEVSDGLSATESVVV